MDIHILGEQSWCIQLRPPGRHPCQQHCVRDGQQGAETANIHQSFRKFRLDVRIIVIREKIVL